MKNYLFAATCAAILAAGVLLDVGCTTSQQTTAANTIGTVSATATAAYDGYCRAIITGIASTNQLPQVSSAYNDLLASCVVAESVAQSGTNALADANLVTEVNALVSLISTATKTK
jgi:hypothetical protein